MTATLKEVVEAFEKLSPWFSPPYQSTILAKGEDMPVRKEAERFARVGVKDCWHPYGLQGLNPERFVMVASHILKGDFDLLGFKHKKAVGDGFSEELYRA